MPIGLQIVTPRHSEELSLKLIGIAHKALQQQKQK
jgi:Asp-tRNA(Asn)/Glu-tRNA(Gln) amidotransferase A subunit family amidase